MPLWGHNYIGPQTYLPGLTTTAVPEQPVTPLLYSTHTNYGNLDPGMHPYYMDNTVPHVEVPKVKVQTTPASSVQTKKAVPKVSDSDDQTSENSDMDLDDMDENNNNVESNIKSSGSRLKAFKECHKILGEIFSGSFHSKAQNLPYYKNPRGDVPLLKIDPDITGSWFDPPDKENPTDSTSYWKSSTPFPRKSRVTPKDYPLKAPPKNPYTHIENEALKQLLEAPIFKSINLDHSAFDVSSVDVTNNPHTNLDALIRSSMMDNFTIDEYLKLLLEIVPKLSLTSTSQVDRQKLLDLAMEVMVIIAECNQRSGQTQVATYVSNKLALRDVVLNRFSSQNTSRDILRGSSFLSHDLFGPLPESFSESLKSSSNKGLRFTRKPFSSHFNSSTRSPFKSTKRPANFLNNPYSKRFKGKWNGNRTPLSRQQFFRGRNQRKR